MNEPKRLVGWIEFESEAHRWAKNRAKKPEAREALDQEFLRLIEENKAVLSEKASVLPHFIRELENTFLRAELERLSGELRALGRARGRVFGRNVNWGLVGRLEKEATQTLSRAPLSPSEKSKLQSLYDLAVSQGRQERLSAEHAASEMHRMLAGRLPLGAFARLWCRPQKLFSLLISLESDVRQLAVSLYEERYGFPARSDVARRLPGPLAKAVVALMDEDLATGILSYLSYLAPGRLNVLYEVERCVWQLPRAERKIVKQKFAALSERAVPNPNRLPVEINLALKHLLNGSAAEYQAYIIAYELRQARYWPLLERLLNCSLEERLRIAAAFEACLSAPLASALEKNLPPGPLCRLADALLSGDAGRILAWRGRCILTHECDEWLGELLRGGSRKAFIAGYESEFGPGSLEPAIAGRYSARDREILVDLLQDGKVSRGKLLWFAVAGFGTDEEALVTLLEKTDRRERERMRAEFREVWERHAPWVEKLCPRLFGVLENRLWLECAGDNWCSLRQLLRGDDGESGELEWLEDIYLHERSGVMMKKLDFLSGEGPVMDRDVQLVRDYFKQTLAERALDPDEKCQFDALIELGELDCSIFRRLKHVIANTVTTGVAGAGVFVAAFSLTVLDVDLVPVMCAVGVTSLVLRFTLKKLLKGDGYHRDEMLADCGFAVVDGGTLYLGRLFRQAVIQIGARFTSRLGLKTSISRFLRGLREVSAEVETETLAELVEAPRASVIAADYPEATVGSFDPAFRSILLSLYTAAE